MHDPMDLGFEICATAVFVWASIDYNRFIKFYMIRPAPYSGRVLIIFRLFFLACVIGALWPVAETAIDSARPAMSILRAIPFAAGCFAVFFVMLHLVERMNRKRRTKQ